MEAPTFNTLSPRGHFTTLHAMIPSKVQSSWLYESFVVITLAPSPPNILLAQAPLSLSSDEGNVHRQHRIHFARLRSVHYLAFCSYKNRLHSKLDSTCRWCRDNLKTVSHIFQKCPQLAWERVELRESKARDLQEEPGKALRFLRAIAFIPGLD